MRINELARELEVKAKAIIDFLPTIGVHDKRSHSSSIEDDLAEKIRRHFGTVEDRGADVETARGTDAGDAAEATRQAERRGGAVAVLEEEPPAEAERSFPGGAERSLPEKAAPVSSAELGAEEFAPVTPRAATPPPAAAGAERSLSGVGRSSVASATRSVLRPPVRPHAPTAAPSAAPPVRPAPAAPAAHAAPIAPSTTAPVASGPPPTAPEVTTARAPSRGPELPLTTPPVSAPQSPRFGVQGRLVVPRPGVPGPVSRAGVAPPAPNVTPPRVSPPTRPITPPGGERSLLGGGSFPTGGAARAGLPTRGITPGQPIYQPRPGAPGRPTRPTGPAQAGAPSPLGRPTRPAPGQWQPGAPQPGRRPMHPTRAHPATSAPPAGVRRPAPRPVPARDRERPIGPPAPTQAAFVAREIDREITITEGLTIKELAEKLGANVKVKDLMQRLIARGIFATINQTLDTQIASDLAADFGALTKTVSFEQEQAEEAATSAETVVETGELVPRPPVVTIMGHVDHGKTSLLDAIRETRVTEEEFGGITQHIGAYQVEIKNRKITFIDTPGHEAFTRMRARGAKVTDIVILVVAADDGVMPQTLEAIDHARAANVPIVVAINKVDKPDAQPERVKRQLADRGLLAEDWGGQTVTVEVSAKQKTNLDLLLEMILLVADIQDLKANPTRPAMGAVLEAKLDRGRGPVATVLVQNGTLHAGDPFIVGAVFSKVRALLDDHGRVVQEAGPAAPVAVLGLTVLPQAGDQFQVVTDIAKAKQMAQFREQRAREAALARSARLTLDQLHEQLKAGAVKELNIILKADVGGSAEVLADTLTKQATEKVKVKIIRAGVGAITESDVLLASTSNAIIIGFNVRPERTAQELAEHEQVEIRLHTIIYEVVDEIRKAMTGLLEPTLREAHVGRAEVRDTFRIPKIGTIAGCYVIDGKITRDSLVRLLRDNVVVYTGRVVSLRRFKDDAREVNQGFECGIGLENYSDIKKGDIIEAFVMEKVATELSA